MNDNPGMMPHLTRSTLLRLPKCLVSCPLAEGKLERFVPSPLKIQVVLRFLQSGGSDSLRTTF
jgi:hypothetical protein